MDPINDVLGAISEDLRALREREEAGEDVAEERKRLLRDTRGGSRYVNEHAEESVVRQVAAGGSVRTVPPRNGARPDAKGIDFLRTVRAAKSGDGRAFEALTKGWAEGSDASGGFLVPPEQLPGYVEARRADGPLRERCASFDARTNEVFVVVEDGSLSVEHVPEGATKPNTTGSVAQKISTIHKVAGTSTLTDELLADTNGAAGDLVARQFGKEIGSTIDAAIISGTGTGQPTGIRNTAGVASTAVSGQTGQALFDSIVNAIGRLASRFYTADTIALHPDVMPKFLTAKDNNGGYLFPEGIAARLPGNPAVVWDANLPKNLGAGSNETPVLIGEFKAACFFFSREPLRLDVSTDAGFMTNEVVYRAEERYGFGVVAPSGLEILTGLIV